MAGIEVRCETLESVSRYVSHDLITAIGIGNEGCVHKIPGIDGCKAAITEIINHGKSVTLILPFIPQQSLGHIKKFIDEIVDYTDAVTFVINDYGLLHYLQKTYTQKVPDIFLGRFFERSLDMVPWKDNILRDETGEIKELVSQSTYAHASKLEFFSLMKVAGMETNATGGILRSCSKIKDYNFKVNVHYKYSTIAFTRACPVYRHLNNTGLKKGDCRSLCEKIVEMEIVKKWEAGTAEATQDDYNQLQPDDDLKEVVPDLFIKGNIIFIENGFSLQDLYNSGYIDTVVINDWAFPGNSQLEEMIDTIKIR